MAIEVVSTPVNFPSRLLQPASDALSFVIAGMKVGEASYAYNRMIDLGKLDIALHIGETGLRTPYLFETTDMSDDETQMAGVLYIGNPNEAEGFEKLLREPNNNVLFCDSQIPTLLSITGQQTETTINASATMVVPSTQEGSHPLVEQLHTISQLANMGEERLSIGALSSFIEQFRAIPPQS